MDIAVDWEERTVTKCNCVGGFIYPTDEEKKKGFKGVVACPRHRREPTTWLQKQRDGSVKIIALKTGKETVREY